MFNKKCLSIDRIIGYDPIKITIGVSNEVLTLPKRKLQPIEYNNFKRQCIKFENDPKLYSLVSYNETKTELHYEFENNIHLKFIKQNNNILYNIKYGNLNETVIMTDLFKKLIKKINFNSTELDKIVDFINYNISSKL
jgi:hypothetical protein